MAPDIALKRVVVAHLGSGASLCALHDSRSVDSTLGFTALDGLCMGTRPGALDPGVVLYLFQELKLTPKQVEELLYKKSGLLGISGISNDMRDLLTNDAPARAARRRLFRLPRGQGNWRDDRGARRARRPRLHGRHRRERARNPTSHLRGVRWLGIALDDAANAAPRGPSLISRSDSRVPVWVVPTNEELMIARHTGRVLELAAVPT